MLCFPLTKQRINPSEWATVRILWVRIDNSCQCLISLIKVDPTQYVTMCIFTGRNTSAHDAYVLILLSPLKKINPFWWTSISNGSRSCLPIVRKHNFCSYLPLDPLWAPTLGKFSVSKQIFGPSFLFFYLILFVYSGQWVADSEPGPGQEQSRSDVPWDEEEFHWSDPGRPDREDVRSQGHEGHHQNGGGLGQNQGINSHSFYMDIDWLIFKVIS